MEKIEAIGFNLLVLPKSEEEHHKTEGGIFTVDQTLTEGLIVSVSEEMKDIYKEGETVIYSKNAGIGQMYNKIPHVWLNGQGHPIGNVLAKISR